MRECVDFKKDLLFDNLISEITSISLECVYDCVDNDVTGKFIVEGTYKTLNISVNRENFNYDIPFSYHFDKPIKKNSALINVLDFTYTIDKDVLKIDVEYEALGDLDNEITFTEEKEFERFLKEHEIDINDDSSAEEVDDEDVILLEEDNVEIKNKTDVLDNDSNLNEDDRNANIKNPDKNEDDREVENSIIDNVSNREDTYIMYHVHVVSENDTIDNIALKYSVTVSDIKEYNSFDTISVGMKLIIPCVNE